MNDLHALAMAMIAFDAGSPKRIQHFIKVHDFARLIGQAEGLDDEAMSILEAAALTHDIGILPAERRFGRSDGPLQEELGPAYAREMLERLSFDAEHIERVCWLIAHHHTYEAIDAPDYRILVEADFLVNLYEHSSDEQAVRAAREKVFRTQAGTEMLDLMLLTKEETAQ